MHNNIFPETGAVKMHVRSQILQLAELGATNGLQTRTKAKKKKKTSVQRFYSLTKTVVFGAREEDLVSSPSTWKGVKVH